MTVPATSSALTTMQFNMRQENRKREYERARAVLWYGDDTLTDYVHHVGANRVVGHLGLVHSRSDGAHADGYLLQSELGRQHLGEMRRCGLRAVVPKLSVHTMISAGMG